MTRLADLPLRQSYRSDEDDLIGDFYVPCLSASAFYRRAVGFFSSSALSVAAKGLHAFLRGGGRMELVASPILSQEDIEAIGNGYKDRRAAEEAALLAALEGPLQEIAQKRLELLAWLIAAGRLDVKIAVHRALGGSGIYHEKLGIFSDGHDLVAFTGSPNESASALTANFECIDVYCSWRPADRERAEAKEAHFARLWEDRTPSLLVYPFPEAARRSLLRRRPAVMPDRDPEHTGGTVVAMAPEGPHLPGDLALRPYQREAIDNWYRARGRGTLKMATGSGKTITALATAARLHRDIALQALVIVVPFRHLVTQWGSECEAFGLRPIRCYESRRDWLGPLEAALSDLVIAKTRAFVCAIATNATFATAAFQQLLRYFPKNGTLIIGDEAHNLGASRLVQALPTAIRWRLALSATPERWFDEEGTQELFDYFGPVLQPEFTLRDALESGALVPYEYHPIFVTLTEDEAERYRELSRKIGQALAREPARVLEDSPQLEALLFRRARLIGAAQNKLVALREVMLERLDTTHTLVYCGDGAVEEPASGETMRHIDAVARLLGRELGYRVATYTAETPLEERGDLARRFDAGELQGLVAIRCLDEGVDIPSTRTAFILASSTNPRQFIQRRGRVLRRAPGKERATIFDFIVEPPETGREGFGTERRLLERELRRYVEFADLALNAGEARGRIVNLQRRYDLLAL